MVRAGLTLKAPYTLPCSQGIFVLAQLPGLGDKQRGNQPGPCPVRSFLPPGKRNTWLPAVVTTTQMSLRCP